MPKLKYNIWLLVTIVLGVALTVYTLTYLSTHPWRSLGCLAGDSAKNSYAYLYQCIYGHGFHFDGMHYPYGDNIVFADGQAALSVPFSLIKGEPVWLMLTVLWWLVSLSYILSFVFIYRILVHYKVPLPLAAVFACLIGIFSPQLFRVTGHYGLSYMCVIPMVFYWTIKYHSSPRWRYCIYIFSLGLFTTFLHFYFSAMMLVWVMFYSMGYFLFTKARPAAKLRHIAPVFSGLVAMLLVVLLIMKLTDPVHDRPVTPYGLLSYITRPEDIYTSGFSPFWQYVSEHHRLTRLYSYVSNPEGGEGYVYMGLTVIFAFFYSLLAGIYSLARRRKENIVVRNDSDGFSPVWLFMAFAALIFAMGIPYMWHTDWLLDHLSFMRQFRSLGRFSWISYYIITIYAVVVIGRRFSVLAASGKAFAGYAVVLPAIALWCWEAKANMQEVRRQTQTSLYNYDAFFVTEANRWDKFMQSHNRKPEEFQGLVMLSYFHTGSDKWWVGECGGNLAHGVIASLQLHLPMVNALLARTSWSQVAKQVKTYAGPFVDKPMLNDLPNNKPILLLKYDHHIIDPDQKYLLEASDYIGHFSNCEVYCCYPDRIRANDKKNADSINAILPFVITGDTCIANKGDWAVMHMEDGRAGTMLFGKGAAPSITGHDSVIAVIPITPRYDSQLYELSCWFLLGAKDPNAPYIMIQSLDSAGNQVRSDDLLVKASVDNEGMWFRGSLYFAAMSNCRAIRCKLVCETIPSYLAMDELMLRPDSSLIISKAADGSVMVNNHLFKKGGSK